MNSRVIRLPEDCFSEMAQIRKFLRLRLKAAGLPDHDFSDVDIIVNALHDFYKDERIEKNA